QVERSLRSGCAAWLPNGGGRSPGWLAQTWTTLPYTARPWLPRTVRIESALTTADAPFGGPIPERGHLVCILSGHATGQGTFIAVWLHCARSQVTTRNNVWGDRRLGLTIRCSS